VPGYQVEIDTKYGGRRETVTANDQQQALALVLDRIGELEQAALARWRAGEDDCVDRVRIGRWKWAQVTSSSVVEVGG
jgi:hypothetical protein